MNSLLPTTSPSKSLPPVEGWNPPFFAAWMANTWHCGRMPCSPCNGLSNPLQYGSIRAPAVRNLDAFDDLLLLMKMLFWICCFLRGGASKKRSSSGSSTSASGHSLSNAEEEERTQKELRISLGRSDELRRGWKEEMRQLAAEDLVFLDGSIFNEKTGWRYRAYGPIGHMRYPADIWRGRTWSICAAVTIPKWLASMCWGQKEPFPNARSPRLATIYAIASSPSTSCSVR